MAQAVISIPISLSPGWTAYVDLDKAWSISSVSLYLKTQYTPGPTRCCWADAPFLRYKKIYSADDWVREQSYIRMSSTL
jgi:hypothetical protein